MASKPTENQHLDALRAQKRIAEEQQKSRIFNSRQRLIGIDVDALNTQIAEKRLKQQEEEEWNRFHEVQAKQSDDMAIMLQRKEEDEMKELQKDIDNFRITHQRKELQKDFDLYDPHSKRKELPARISDEDPRCSVSGLQKMEGEDLRYGERNKIQKEQCRNWLIDQMLDKRMQQEKHEAARLYLEERMKSLDNQAALMMEQENQFRRNLAKEISEFNQNMALQQRLLKRQKGTVESMDNSDDINCSLNGGLLNEDPSRARSAFGSHRVVPDRWKGMTPEQLAEYHEGRKNQIMENQRLKERKNLEDHEWENLQFFQNRQATLMERSEQRKKQYQKQELLLENQRLADEQKRRKEYLEKVVYSNVPTKDFYSQFNTSRR